MSGSNAFRNAGDNWDELLAWLQNLRSSGLFRVPSGPGPNFVPYEPDGSVVILDVNTGRVLDAARVGDWVVLGPDGFTVERF